tara:strand:+ start:62 stop:688 length:627 start_codon:yes stop_codon:yes gene_type:complete
MDPNEHFLPSIQVTLDKLASSKIALVIFAPVKLTSNKFAPLKDAANKFAPSKLTFAKLELSNTVLLQLAYCKFAENKFELLKLPKIKLPNDIFALFNCDFSKFTIDKLTPDISAPTRETPDKSISSTKLQFVQSTSFSGWSLQAALIENDRNDIKEKQIKKDKGFKINIIIIKYLFCVKFMTIYLEVNFNSILLFCCKSFGVSPRDIG